jgi:hypothetical protein
MNPAAGVQVRPLVAVVILASLVVGFVVWWGSRGGYARRPSDSSVECQQRYAQAAPSRTRRPLISATRPRIGSR